ncbi:DUF1366 domain-containing protein [uncultured Streptococcus sp.]|uniref:DUF1366 domain-containing protein n=1 Tax=uncultured Streptococcus sp. TaxID=83427 RepID=UPI002583A125|nr:DUF1366 domain-containing protein [uncultured Streptococcus sp.]
MKLSFNSKSQEIGLDGSIVGTRVVLSNNDGGFLPVMLPADKISLSNVELEELALDVIYQENFRDKYENEKFAEMQAGLAKQKESSEIAQATLLDVVTQLYDKGVLTDEIIEEN